MTNMDTKRKLLSAPNEIARANELNNFYLRFDTDNDNTKECMAVLENVNCDMNSDRFLLNHMPRPRSLKLYTLTKPQAQIICLCLC